MIVFSRPKVPGCDKKRGIVQVVLEYKQLNGDICAERTGALKHRTDTMG
jgi:hypothetical protein